MERGVVVGGLMICGSFLLAALLNRCAMEESAPSATVSAPSLADELTDSGSPPPPPAAPHTRSSEP
jgi:hypothetical protein